MAAAFEDRGERLLSDEEIRALFDQTFNSEPEPMLTFARGIQALVMARSARSLLPADKLAQCLDGEPRMYPHERMIAHLKAALREAELADMTHDYARERDGIETLLEEVERERICWAEARRER